LAQAPVGQRIRKRRRELALSQIELASRAGISPSYLNLIEHNKLSLGGKLLHRIAAAIDLDSRALAGTEEARLIAELGEVVGDTALQGVEFRLDDARDLVATSPQSARAILALYRAYHEARVRSDLIGERLGEESFLAEASNQILALITTIRSYSEILKDYGDLSDAERHRFVATLVDESERLAAHAGEMFDFIGGRGRRRPRPSPREEIEDFISDHANYFPGLEEAAERLASELGGDAPTLESLAGHLQRRHGVRVERRPVGDLPPIGERFDGEGRLALVDTLSRGSVRFRLARRLGELEFGGRLDELTASAGLSSEDASRRLKRALASYLAGALTMPYADFRQAASASRHDILRLGARFDASFEQVCHRLATLRRPGAEGVPIHFMRTDIAGNISKRFTASGLRLPRYGGACPRWIVHRAFSSPGQIMTQIAGLPDGETYVFVARADLVATSDASQHAVMIGASIVHAAAFACFDGTDLSSGRAVVPVGITCRQCPREDCSQRAFERIPVPGGAEPLRQGNDMMPL
jgi:predicted transcriptional regulator/transcriptional regulator with XRE-family HTH domain